MFFPTKPIALAVLVAGCTQSEDVERFAALTVDEEPGLRMTSATRWLSACPTRHPTADILDPPARVAARSAAGPGGDRFARGGAVSGAATAAAVSMIADFAVAYTQGLLKDYKDAVNAQTIATGVFLGAERLSSGGVSIEEDQGCLVVYSGLAGPAKGGAKTGLLTPAHLSALNLAAPPAFYAEFSVTPGVTDDARVLTLNHVFYGATAARRQGSGQKSIVLNIVLGAYDTEKANEAVTETYQLNLGRLEIGRYYGADPAVRAISAAKVKPGSAMVSVVTEAEKTSVAYDALVTAFEQNKDKLGGAIEQGLSNAATN